MSVQKILTMIRRKTDEGKSQSRGGILLVERRRHPRICVELPFDYSRVEGVEGHRGIMAEASEGGLLVFLLEKIEIGALLRIEILFAKETELTTIRAIVKVVWSDLAAKESWAEYQYGLQFLSFFEGDLNKLKVLLKEVGRPHK
jgi:hypothetical protein